MTFSEVIFDAHDVDTIVRDIPICEIDKIINETKIRLKYQENPQIIFYLKDKIAAYELARDVSEWCFKNNIITFTIQHSPDRRLDKVISAQTKLDKRLYGIENFLKNRGKYEPNTQYEGITSEADYRD